MFYTYRPPTIKYNHFNQMQAVNGLENTWFLQIPLFDNTFHTDTLIRTVSWDSDSIVGKPLPRITIINTQYIV